MTFGDVEVGTSSTQNVTLSNTGTSSLAVSQAAVSGAGFTMTGQTFPLMLSAGQTSNLTVQFAPTVSGTATGNVSIVSSASNSATSVSLNGNGVKHHLSISPGSVSFGNVMVGTASTQTVTLTNSGTASLSISQGSVTGPGYGMSGLTFPFSLAPGQSSTFNTQFDPTVAGNASGSVSISSNAHNSPTVASLAGTGTQPTVSLSSTGLSFGNVGIGSSSAQILTITNTGTATLTLTQGSLTGAAFSLGGATFPLNIAPGASNSLTVTFAPTVAGSASGTLTIASNAPNSPAIVALSGSGVQGALATNPSSFNFGNVVVGTSGMQTFTLSNSGTTSVTISAGSASGTGFSITGLSLPLTLGPGQSTPFTAQFAPSATGSANGSVSITSNAAGSPLAIALSGTGVQPVLSVTPTNVAFGSVITGNNTSQTITLKNTGTASLTISQATVSGTGFAISGLTLPTTIATGGSTTFSVSFAPSTAGSATGTVSLVSNASSSSLAIALNGTGVNPTFVLSANPTTLNFGNVSVGSSTSQTVTLTNTGNSSVSISQVNVPAGFITSGLAVTLSSGQTATFSVTFAPTSSGSLTGNATVTSNASSPVTVALAGTGVQPGLSIAPPSVSFGNVVIGTTSTQSVALTNSGTANLIITRAAVSGSGIATSGLTLPLTLTPGQTTNFSVAFSPTTTGSISGSVTLTSNAPNSPAAVAISGAGIAASTLTVSPTNLSFGSVAIGKNSSLSVTVTNAGNSNVTISNVSVSGAGFNASGLSSGTILTPNQTATLNVIFAPASTGSMIGSVTLTSNAGNSPTVVTLSGTGVQLIAHTTDLAWTASGSAGYNVYRGTVSGGPYTRLNASLVAPVAYTDSTVQSGQTYYYVVTAVDSNNVESPHSNEVTAVIPFP